MMQNKGICTLNLWSQFMFKNKLTQILVFMQITRYEPKHQQCFQIRQLYPHFANIYDSLYNQFANTLRNSQNQNRTIKKNFNKKNLNFKEEQQRRISNTLDKGLQLVYHIKQQFVPINTNDDFFQKMLAGMVELQVVMMEMSPQKKKLQQLKKYGQKFIDDRFKPSQQSLTGQWGYIEEWKDFKWKKISDVIKNPQIFVGKIEANDIRQGFLSDCYFLAGLAALAEVPQRIYNLFLLQQLNNQNFFSVKMLYRGKWMIIDMDEYIPVYKKQPAFSRNRQNELWVILLEKAWAKLYTSYKRIQYGYPEQVLHDLTGAPIKEIFIQHEQFNEEQQWSYLVQSTQKRYAIVATSQIQSDDIFSTIGVVKKHSYTFLKAFSIQFKGQQERIVKLRNPFGKIEPHGVWDDSDQRWNLLSQQQKRKVGFQGKADDGVFFMSWKSFCKEFYSVTVAQINDKASYTYLSHKDPNLQGCFFKVQIFQNGRYSFQVDKPPQKSYKEQDRYKYPSAKLSIASYANNKIINKKQVRSRDKRTLFKSYKLKKGTYLVQVKIDFQKHQERQFDVNLAIYGDRVCNIALASNQQANYLNNRITNWKGGNSFEYQTSWNSLSSINWQINNLIHEQKLSKQDQIKICDKSGRFQNQSKLINSFHKIKSKKYSLIIRRKQTDNRSNSVSTTSKSQIEDGIE